jgi:uncharacterized protein
MPAKPVCQAKQRHHRKAATGPAYLSIRSSQIHEDGVYTSKPIRKGEIVAEYTGTRLTNEEADALYDNHYRTYLFGLEDRKNVIDGEGVAAFINHSCDPNCEVEEVGGRIFIRTIREIVAGEEVTYDYNLYDGSLDDPAPCTCGAANCRGTMYSEKEIARRTRVTGRKRGGARRMDRRPR